MTTAVAHPPTRKMLPRHPRWLTVLVTGSALYLAVFAALLGTQDILFVPSLLLVGSAVVPVTFITFLGGMPRRGDLSFAQIASAAALGGVIGTVVAGSLEAETIRELGSLPTLTIGLIEESAKLAIPAIILTRRKPRPSDGLVLGVAVGSGFAALETMGYALVALVGSGGHLESVTHLLVVRSVAEPGGHAAWTGLACAALFAIRGSRRRWFGWLRFFCVFAGVVALHATWDSLATGHGYLLVGGASFTLLMAVTWYLHLHRGTGAATAPTEPANGAVVADARSRTRRLRGRSCWTPVLQGHTLHGSADAPSPCSIGRQRNVEDADVEQRHARGDQADRQRSPSAPIGTRAGWKRQRRPGRG